MSNTEHSRITPIVPYVVGDIGNSQEIETALLVEEMDSLESISGISMADFRVADSNMVADVGKVIGVVIYGISRFVDNEIRSVSRETYPLLGIENDFLLFIESSLNAPMSALDRIHHTVNDVQEIMDFGIKGNSGAFFLNAFEQVLASNMYSRLEMAIREHNQNVTLSVRDIYALLSSNLIKIIDEMDNDCMGISGFGYARKMAQWFFGKSRDVNEPKKTLFQSVSKPKSNGALSFYVNKKEPDISLSSGDSLLKQKDTDYYPYRYTYISVSESVVFIEMNRLFKDFYINRNTFEHRVNEFLTDIAILVSTYTLFIRQASMIGDISDSETDLKVCLERLCLGAETLKSITHNKKALKILGLSKFDQDKYKGSTEDLMGCIREAAENCQSIAHTILSQHDIWDLLPITDNNAVILETGKSDVVDTMEKLNTILDYLDELKDISSVLDIQRISFTLKQLHYKLKLSGV